MTDDEIIRREHQRSLLLTDLFMSVVIRVKAKWQIWATSHAIL